jgi:CheY-like chemotaxis protein
MAEEVLARAFEPFFTTKAFGDGSGLGLSTVYGFAEQSGGSVSIDTQLGRGTTVNLFLPQAESIKTIVSSALPIETEGEKESILLVEDNADVRAFAATVLDNLNYTVIEAENGDDALVMFEKMPIDLLFSDVLLPGSLNGKALARTILARDPTLPVVLASENWDLANSGGTSDVPEEAIVLQKPYTATQLSAIIQKLFDEQKSGRVGS